ncbi:MFS transporter [Methylocapsa sp. S129]|uniref:MFS transporter n=1 Tax=Methylocapsa sp. S129 TaxID=1641869 RepID=UPI00131AA634|nr:MFS transporter [Methylocapsa sp. S129]
MSKADLAVPPARERAGQIYSWYLVAVLATAYAFSFLDRYVLSLLVEPIKRDFGLSDVNVSLLQGFAFSIFLVVSGLPIGRLVDRSRRMTIIALGVACWSLMTVGCGLASGFLGLLLCRIGVAIGEATLLPAGFSVIIDAVPRKRLGLAFGLFTMGAYIGAGLAFLLGAALIARLAAYGGLSLPLMGDLKPWQGVFVLIGAPGLLLAFWAATLREPVRRHADVSTGASLSDVMVFFRSNARTLTCLLLCGAFGAMSAQAMTAWVPSLLIRTYGFTTAQAGTAFGAIVIPCGILGVIAGGLIGDALTNRGLRDGRLRAMIGGSLLALPFAVVGLLAGDARLTLALLTPAIFFYTLLISNSPAALQEMLPSRLQGVTTAVAVLVSNLIGLGLGPTSVAFVTDFVLRDEAKLRYSLAIVSATALTLSVIFGLLARRPYLASRASLDNLTSAR